MFFMGEYDEEERLAVIKQESYIKGYIAGTKERIEEIELGLILFLIKNDYDKSNIEDTVKYTKQYIDDIERLVKDNPNIKVEEIYNELIENSCDKEVDEVDKEKYI